MRIYRLLPLACALTLAACATTTSQPVLHDGKQTLRMPAPLTCATKVQPEAKVHLDMIDNLIADGRNHAALAELQATAMDSVKHWLRYGQLEARTGQLNRAESVFKWLANQCQAPAAWHGLGMVKVKDGELGEGLVALQKAASQLPADVSVRNDYGYALMKSGQYRAAIFQLRTALELNNGHGPARENLAMAYLLAGDKNGIALMQHQYKLTSGELNFAKKLLQGFEVTTIGTQAGLSGSTK